MDISKAIEKMLEENAINLEKGIGVVGIGGQEDILDIVKSIASFDIEDISKLDKELEKVGEITKENECCNCNYCDVMGECCEEEDEEEFEDRFRSLVEGLHGVMIEIEEEIEDINEAIRTIEKLDPEAYVIDELSIKQEVLQDIIQKLYRIK